MLRENFFIFNRIVLTLGKIITNRDNFKNFPISYFFLFFLFPIKCLFTYSMSWCIRNSKTELVKIVKTNETL